MNDFFARMNSLISAVSVKVLFISLFSLVCLSFVCCFSAFSRPSSLLGKPGGEDGRGARDELERETEKEREREEKKKN